MKTLLDIEDELATARQFVECAYRACHGTDGSDSIAAVLDVASDKIRVVIATMERLRETYGDVLARLAVSEAQEVRS